MSIIDFKKIIAQIALRIKSKGRYKYVNLMRDMEYKTSKECVELQKEKLFEIVSYSIKNVPFYRAIAKEQNIKLSKETILENIQSFPILRKQDLKRDFVNLKSEGYKGFFFKNTSGGSTGEPTTFLQGLESKETGKGSKIFFDKWVNKEGGDRVVKIWGSEREILQGTQGKDGFISEKILNIKTLNAFKMGNKEMNSFVNTINKEKPIVIEAYVQSIYELAKFIKRNKLKIHSPEGLIATAGTVYEEMKELVEEVFGCKVFNQYGSREVGLAAFSCEKQEGLHMNMFDQYIEILNEDMEPCLAGETGRVYITTLNNYAMPLIRYDMGDFATVSKKSKCSCGRGFPLIEQIEGREMSVFRTKEGGIVPGEFFIHFIGVVFNKGFISKFQAIQEDYNCIIIKVVVENEEQFDKEKKKIIDSIKKVMGNECKVKFEVVSEIKPLESGKYLYTLSKVE